MSARLLLFWIVCVAASVLAGCGRAPSAARSSQSEAVQVVGEGGPLQVTLRVSPTLLTTAERISVRIEARAASGVEPGDIDLAKSLPEGLSIVGQKTDRRATEHGATLVIREWTVEPFLAGEYEIGALKVNDVETTPVDVVVSSVLKPGEEELAEAKPIVDPPAEAPRWVWWAMGGAGALAIIFAWIIAAGRRRVARGPDPVFIPAHELAMQRLAGLMSRRLVEAGRFKEFYDEASLILRCYIEDRFGLHAPERTTEEFLEETRSSSALMDDDVRVLRKFLSHCDMVKFAAVIPSTPEAEGVAGTVREFIDRTKNAERVVQVEPEASA